MLEIRFHGRGGQGAVTAANVLAVAAFKDGKYAQAFGAFGPERRGAPVAAFCRIDDKAIRLRQQVYEPSIVAVFEPSLVKAVDVLAGLDPKGTLLVNIDEEQDVKNLGLDFDGKAYKVDATKIALEELKKPIVNTAILGALVRATGIVTIESVKEAVKERFASNEKLQTANVNAVEKAHEKCYTCQLK